MKRIRKEENEIEYVPLENSREYYQITDLGLATALCCKNYELVALDKNNTRRVEFLFKREIGIEQDADAYWSNELESKCRSYFDNLRTLKNRIYSE